MTPLDISFLPDDLTKFPNSQAERGRRTRVAEKNKLLSTLTFSQQSLQGFNTLYLSLNNLNLQNNTLRTERPQNLRFLS